MKLPADAVIFVFHVKRPGERREDFVLGFRWRRKHEFHGTEHSQRDLVQLAMSGKDRSFSDIAKNHVGAADGFAWAIEGFRDGFLDRVLLETDPEIAGNDLDYVFRFGGYEGSEQIEKRRKLVGGSGNLHQIGELRLNL